MKIKDIQNEIKNIKLDPTERRIILERVTTTRVRSPYAPIPSKWKFTHRPLVYTLASLLLLVMSGGSVTSASLGSIPGDSLYKFKVRVAEPVLGALNRSGESQVKWQAQKALRRLDEATKLVERNKFTAEHRAEIEILFNKSVLEFDKTIKSEETKAEVPKLKTDAIRDSFEKSLNSQADVLKEAKTTTDKKQEIEITILENTVRAKVSLPADPTQEVGETEEEKSEDLLEGTIEEGPMLEEVSEIEPIIEETSVKVEIDTKI
ncbi:MAG: hypothetical protein WD991_00015 [Candidatus Paceibacterota bacterium]